MSITSRLKSLLKRHLTPEQIAILSNIEKTALLRGYLKRSRLIDLAYFIVGSGVYPRPLTAHAARVSAGHKAPPYIFGSTFLGTTEPF